MTAFELRKSSESDRVVSLWSICILGGLLLIVLPAAIIAEAPEATATPTDHPRYKPSSRSPEPMDIRTNAYGASRSAPDALEIGDTAPDFTLPRAGGGALSLADLRGSGPVALIFYRGHW
jgi:hypothetical protein